jgi:alkanesulfonate monooxygenase SsuD/methylene tetrahydromethanopterin reductase-like flavin-dependent oxidoreductase (luciferase family)
MLSIALPIVDSWNVWYSHYGNSVDGFREVRTKVDAVAESVGRDPASVDATAAVLVRFPGGSGRVMGDYSVNNPAPVTGSPAEVAAHLAALADAGAAHVQLVLDPITTATIQLAGEVVAELRE